MEERLKERPKERLKETLKERLKEKLKEKVKEASEEPTYYMVRPAQKGWHLEENVRKVSSTHWTRAHNRSLWQRKDATALHGNAT